MNFVLAWIWLVGACGVFLYEAIVAPMPYRFFNRVSIGWFGLVLSAYNFVRWYSVRMAAADRQAERLVESSRARQRADRARPEPDPTFDFTNQPPAPRPPHDVPPSNN